MSESEKISSIKSLISPLVDPVIDLADERLETIISAISESDILKEISFIRSFIAVGKFGSAVRNIHFIKKYAAFIGVLSHEISPDERERLIEELEKDPKLAGKIAEKIILSLDRFHTNRKAVLLARLFFKTFHENKFSVDEYNKLMFSIEMIHPVDGLERLEEYYRFYVDMSEESDKKKRSEIWAERAKLDFSSLAMTGLLNLPRGGAYAGNWGGASLNELGARFFEEVCLEVE